MFRSPWFWITIVLIAAGVALTAAVGALYWLVAACVTAVVTLLIAFLAAAYVVGHADPLKIPHLEKVPRSERIPVIYDCNLAMGRPFRDVGDGLVLLYLLGEPRVYLRFVTTTYGNGSVEVTTRMTRRLLERLGRDDIATIRGAAGPDDAPETNRAARYLKDIVGQEPGRIALIATGSMTNLRHAAALDANFFSNLRGLYVLGGATEPLIWNGHQLAELNFSLDPEAANLVVHADCPLTVATGQAGLSAIFRSPQFAALQALDDPVSRLVARRCRFWFAVMRLYFRDGGFPMWDSVAALALTRPELFECERARIPSVVDDLRTGRLVVDVDRDGPARIVRGVRDFDGFVLAHFAAWRRLGRRISG